MTGTTPNRELVVYALHLLGGEAATVHTEDIAIKCHELFPDSFSWTKYPDLPDKDIVRVALTDARKEKHGALVEGRSGQSHGLVARTSREPAPDGWRLTSQGVLWIRSAQADLERLLGKPETKEHRQKLLQQLRRVREHSLFDAFLADPHGFHTGIGQIADLMQCRVDSEPRVWESRFANLRNKAIAAEQQDVIQFLDKCEREYQAQR